MKLELYYKTLCPFCQKVLKFIQENNIRNVDLKDAAAYPQLRDELIQTGGKGQVPCLLIDGQALYESDDIIQWLKDNIS